VQNQLHDVSGDVSRGVDAVQPILPEPLEDAVDVVQRGTGDAVEVVDRAVDLGQRLTSPDLLGDVALDSWDFAHDHAGDLGEAVLDLLPG